MDDCGVCRAAPGFVWVCYIMGCLNHWVWSTELLLPPRQGSCPPSPGRAMSLSCRRPHSQVGHTELGPRASHSLSSFLSLGSSRNNSLESNKSGHPPEPKLRATSTNCCYEEAAAGAEECGESRKLLRAAATLPPGSPPLWWRTPAARSETEP